MNEHRNVDNQLVVDEFVALSHVEDIVNPHDLAPPFVLADDYLLELSLLGLNDLGNGRDMLVQVIVQFVSGISGVTFWYRHLNRFLDDLGSSLVAASDSHSGLNTTIQEELWLIDEAGAASLQLDTVEILGLEELLERLKGLPGVDSFATGEEVGGRVAELGPGVDAKVALLNDDNAGHAMGLKEVAVGFDHGGTSLLGCNLHGLAKLVGLVKSVEISLEKLGDDVASQVLVGGVSGGRLHDL